MRVEVFSDIVCPFCWIGKHRLETAIRNAGLAGEVDVVYRAFELNPDAPGATSVLDYLRSRYGPQAPHLAERARRMAADEGLTYNVETAVVARTFDAHRLVLLAQERGLGSAMTQRLMDAHFRDGVDVSDHDALVRLAEEVGLPADEARAALASDDWAQRVRADKAQAAQLGIGGVPFFVLDGRYALSGAQPVAVFEHALRVARQEGAAAAGVEDDRAQPRE